MGDSVVFGMAGEFGREVEEGFESREDIVDSRFTHDGLGLMTLGLSTSSSGG